MALATNFQDRRSSVVQPTSIPRMLVNRKLEGGDEKLDRQDTKEIRNRPHRGPKKM
jgi:hypothetical protein